MTLGWVFVKAVVLVRGDTGCGRRLNVQWLVRELIQMGARRLLLAQAVYVHQLIPGGGPTGQGHVAGRDAQATGQEPAYRLVGPSPFRGRPYPKPQDVSLPAGESVLPGAGGDADL